MDGSARDPKRGKAGEHSNCTMVRRGDYLRAYQRPGISLFLSLLAEETWPDGALFFSFSFSP
jgi:hypothetical protein